MKRKYAAIALGLTLALSSTAAFAEGTTEAAATETAAASEATDAAADSALETNEENTETFLGQITEITEDSIKITNSRLIPVSDTEDAEIAAENAAADAADDTADDAENTSENAGDTAENADGEVVVDIVDENAEASADGAESTGEADDVSLTAVLELSPDQTTTIDYSEATSFKLLTDQYTLTITDNGLMDAPAGEDMGTPADEAAKAPTDEVAEAAADENAEAAADEDMDAPADEDMKAPADEAAKMPPAEQNMASLIPTDAITEVITADDLQEGDVIYVVLNDEGTADEITVLAKGDTIAAVYSEADAQ